MYHSGSICVNRSKQFHGKLQNKQYATFSARDRVKQFMNTQGCNVCGLPNFNRFLLWMRFSAIHELRRATCQIIAGLNLYDVLRSHSIQHKTELCVIVVSDTLLRTHGLLLIHSQIYSKFKCVGFLRSLNFSEAKRVNIQIQKLKCQYYLAISKANIFWSNKQSNIGRNSKRNTQQQMQNYSSFHNITSYLTIICLSRTVKCILGQFTKKWIQTFEQTQFHQVQKLFCCY
ncbi:Hypothetical_protein [Hexamita inflata]|uniref:Hypothetical_protein n=1 Tax=Hexamita inflata TaxID=28002 RepID=A0AA86QMJ2_9EUKA|nr:Hypothetical protein HINF_LOCUS50059 [Hexamita inflata]